MTFLMIFFGVLILICMVLLNPASRIVDKVLVGQQPWHIEAVDAPKQAKIEMACGTQVQLLVQGGRPEIDVWAESSNPSVASIAYQDNGLWLYAHQSGPVTVALKTKSEIEKTVATLKVESLQVKKAILMMDQQLVKPDVYEICLPNKNQDAFLSYRWFAFANQTLLGIATSQTPFVELATDHLTLASTQHMAFEVGDAQQAITCMLLNETYSFHPLSANQGQMRACVKNVLASNHFTKGRVHQKTFGVDVQLQTQDGQPLLMQKNMGRPTEIRWRAGQGDFSPWTRPYEKDKPITYVVQQTLDEHSRWYASIILHPSIAEQSGQITLEIRHRDFSDRSISLEQSLFIPTYTCTIQQDQPESTKILTQWL